jgi:hypothetical protein
VAHKPLKEFFMLNPVKTSLLIFVFLLFYPGLLFSQIPASWAEKEIKPSDPEALEIISKAEAKLYSPLDQGLKDLHFMYAGGFDKVKQTFWFKSPDLWLGMVGNPDLSVTRDKKPKITGNKVLEVEIKITDIQSRRAIARVLGRPISCFLPFGSFELISQNPGGSQIRYTTNNKNPLESIWTNVDFYFDGEFRLTKIMEKTSSGDVLENQIKLKPYKEGETKLVLDEVVTFVGTKIQRVSLSKFHYEQVGPYHLLQRIDLENKKEGKKDAYIYSNYQVDQGLDDKLFDR